jgi:hypothetical protein
MIKRLIYSIVLLFFSNVCTSQDTLEFRKKENYSIAIEYYAKLSNNSLKKAYFEYKIASYYSLLNNIDSAYIHISKSIDEGVDFTYILADTDLEAIRKSDKWTYVENQIKNKYLSKNSNITNVNLSYFLLKAYVEDQKYRSLRSFYKLDTFPKNHSIILQQNIKDLLDTIKINGWPLYSQVGLDAGNYVFYIFQHSDNKFMKKVLPLLINAAENYQADKKLAAMMIDRFLMNHFQPQIYGTQIISYMGGNKKGSFLYKVVDEKNLNKRRQKIGMEPIEIYCLDMGVNYIHIEERNNVKTYRIRKRWYKKGYFL